MQKVQFRSTCGDQNEIRMPVVLVETGLLTVSRLRLKTSDGLKKWESTKKYQRNPCDRVSFILENKRMKSDLEAAHLSSEAEKKEVNILYLSLKQKDAEIGRLKELTR